MENENKKSIDGNVINIISFKFFIQLIIVFSLTCLFVTGCSHGERKYVFFGEDGYTQYELIGNKDGIHHVLYNNGIKSYYVATVTETDTNHSWFYKAFFTTGFSSCRDRLYKEIEVHPGDTVLIRSNTEIIDRWKYTDECGHPIPFYYIRCVGYFEGLEFHRF